LEEQIKTNNQNVAIVRLEQMYPTPFKQLEAIKTKYGKAEFVWVQEEPENMGPWPFICRTFRKLSFNFELISRKASSSPATGFAKQHAAEQLAIVTKAFEGLTAEKIITTKKSAVKA
jgi:2-oxoglutarate dehydrogenase E1 component